MTIGALSLSRKNTRSQNWPALRRSRCVQETGVGAGGVIMRQGDGAVAGAPSIGWEMDVLGGICNSILAGSMPVLTFTSEKVISVRSPSASDGLNHQGQRGLRVQNDDDLPHVLGEGRIDGRHSQGDRWIAGLPQSGGALREKSGQVGRDGGFDLEMALH